MHPIAGPVLLFLLGLALLAAAWTDLRRRLIANRLNAAIALAAPAWWWASGLSPWPDVAWQLGFAAMVFAVFAALFAAGLMGGGDVKLLGALALWLPPAAMLPLLLLMSAIGGGVALATLAWHRLRGLGGRAEVPYGVAIAAAGLWATYERYVYHFA